MKYLDKTFSVALNIPEDRWNAIFERREDASSEDRGKPKDVPESGDSRDNERGC